MTSSGKRGRLTGAHGIGLVLGAGIGLLIGDWLGFIGFGLVCGCVIGYLFGDFFTGNSKSERS